MSKFFEDTLKGLKEAIEIEKGLISLKEKENMPAPTFFVDNDTREEKNEKVNNRNVFS